MILELQAKHQGGKRVCRSTLILLTLHRTFNLTPQRTFGAVTVISYALVIK